MARNATASALTDCCATSCAGRRSDVSTYRCAPWPTRGTGRATERPRRAHRVGRGVLPGVSSSRYRIVVAITVVTSDFSTSRVSTSSTSRSSTTASDTTISAVSRLKPAGNTASRHERDARSGEEVVTPPPRRLEGALARPPLREQLEPVVEPGRDSSSESGPEARQRRVDGERKTVEAAADVPRTCATSADVGVEGRSRAGTPGPGTARRHRMPPARARSSVTARGGVLRPARPARPRTSRLVARIRTPGQRAGSAGRTTRPPPRWLAVVEHQQQLAVARASADRVGQRLMRKFRHAQRRRHQRHDPSADSGDRKLTNHTPSRNAGNAAVAASKPGGSCRSSRPVRVTSRLSRSAWSTSASSGSTPHERIDRRGRLLRGNASNVRSAANSRPRSGWVT